MGVGTRRLVIGRYCRAQIETSQAVGEQVQASDVQGMLKRPDASVSALPEQPMTVTLTSAKEPAMVPLHMLTARAGRKSSCSASSAGRSAIVARPLGGC